MKAEVDKVSSTLWKHRMEGESRGFGERGAHAENISLLYFMLQLANWKKHELVE
jgi:hypothetical protein